jgi:serine/threonine-protein kinase RsbW
MSPQLAPFGLTLPNDLRLLSMARHFVESVCGNLEYDRCFSEAIQIATHEALQNVMRHAHRNRPGALIHLQILPLEEGVEVRLLDEGDRFDIACVPHMEPGELRIGGRGVFLIRRLMDQVHSEPRSPQGNLLRMVKWDRSACQNYA